MRVKSDNAQVDRSLEQVWAESDKQKRHPFYGGVLLSADLEAATPKRFTHGLGRAWKGWIVVDTTGVDVVYRANLTSTNKKQEIYLQSASASKVTIFLF